MSMSTALDLALVIESALRQPLASVGDRDPQLQLMLGEHCRRLVGLLREPMPAPAIDCCDHLANVFQIGAGLMRHVGTAIENRLVQPGDFDLVFLATDELFNLLMAELEATAPRQQPNATAA